MYSLKISRILLPQALEFKNVLITDGLIMDEDFTWRWLPQIEDSGLTTQQHSQIEFKFCSPAVATFYQLKWS